MIMLFVKFMYVLSTAKHYTQVMNVLGGLSMKVVSVNLYQLLCHVIKLIIKKWDT